MPSGRPSGPGRAIPRVPRDGTERDEPVELDDDADTVIAPSGSLEHLAALEDTTGVDEPTQGISGQRPITVPSPAPISESPARPRPLSASDVAPLFRGDLKIQRTRAGFAVQDPQSGSTFNLNEYEVSLARMLNGSRPVSEILESSRRLGIPMNLESLQSFIFKLEDAGLLTSTARNGEANAWQARGQWETGVRSLFQTGLKLLRMGKHAEAASYFEVLLEQDPENVEARELLEMARQPAPPPRAPAAPAAPQPPVTARGAAPATPRPPVRTPPHMPATRPSQSVPMETPTQSVPVARPSQSLRASSSTGSLSMPQPSPPPVARMMTAPEPQMRSPVHPVYPASSLRKFAPIAVALVLVAGIGGYLIARHVSGKSRSEPAPAPIASNAPPPVVTPAKPQPAVTPSAKPDATVVETAPPDAAVAEAARPDAAVAAPPPPDKPQPPVSVRAPIGGDVSRVYLEAARHVEKGEKLFEITYAVSNPEKVRALKVRIAELEKIANQDDQGGFVPASVMEATSELSKARKELAAASKIQRVVVQAERAGMAKSVVTRGNTVKAGTVLAEITP